MSGAPSLLELQRWMRWALTHPAGVERALEGPPVSGLPSRFHPPSPGCEALVAGEEAPGRRARDRLSVYASGYFSRLHGALQVEFPGVEEALGEAAFREALGHHLLAHPSSSPSLADLGAGFDATLRRLPLAPALRWVPDLAALERALAEVWLGEVGAPGPGALAAGEDAATLGLALAPTVRLVRTGWTVDLWRGDPGKLREERRWLLAWREGASVGTAALAPAAFALLEALAGGASLGEACEAAGRLGATPEAVQADFEDWGRRGWLVARTRPAAPGAP